MEKHLKLETSAPQQVATRNIDGISDI